MNDSFPEWLLTLAAASAGAVGLAWVVTLFLRRKSAALRHFVWLLALSAPLLALPLGLAHFRIAVPILPAKPEPVPDFVSNQESALQPSDPAQPDNATVDPIPSPSRTPAEANSAPAAQPRSKSSPVNPWFAVWFLGAAFIIGRILFSQMKVRKLVREGCSPSPEDLIVRLNRARQHFRLKRPVRLMVTPLTEIPFCHGVFWPVVIFPESWPEWDDERIEVCLTHELAHVVRHDLLAMLAGQLACILCWFNPLVWFAAGKLRDEAERSADDLVLARNIRPETYAANLVAITESYRASSLSPVISLSMARPNRLKSRVVAILDSSLRRKSPGRVMILTVTLLALGVLFTGMVVRLTAAPAPTPPQPVLPGDKMTTKDAMAISDPIVFGHFTSLKDRGGIPGLEDYQVGIAIDKVLRGDALTTFDGNMNVKSGEIAPKMGVEYLFFLYDAGNLRHNSVLKILHADTQVSGLPNASLPLPRPGPGMTFPADATTQQTTPAPIVPVPAVATQTPPDWGKANSAGIQVRLQAVKLPSTVTVGWDETPSLTLDLRNSGSKPISYLGAPEKECKVEVDGLRYRWSGSATLDTQAKILRPGEEKTGILTVKLTNDWVLAFNGMSGGGAGGVLAFNGVPMAANEPLHVRLDHPGRHTVRVVFYPDGSDEPTEAVQSNLIEIDVAETDGPPRTTYGVEPDEAQVRAVPDPAPSPPIATTTRTDNSTPPPTIPDSAWEQFPEGVAFAMTLTEQTEKGVQKGTLHFYLKNTSKTDKNTSQDNNNNGCIFFVLYINDHGAPVPLRMPPPIYRDAKDTVISVKRDEILSRTMDITSNELALLKTHAVQCQFGLSDSPLTTWSWLKSTPKILTITSNEELRPDSTTVAPGTGSPAEQNGDKSEGVGEQPTHELSGSRVKLPDAANAETIFVGTILDISPYGDAAAAGGSHFWPRIKVTKVLRGWIDNPVTVQIFVMYNPHEEPPRKGSSYIFFVDKIPGWNLGRKLLPATEDAIKQVGAAIPPQSPSNNFFCGDDLKPETAMTKSDAIFTGTVEDVGNEDSSDSYSFAYPARHVIGMKIAVDQVLRGDVKVTTTVTAFTQAIPPPDQIRGPYIFYVKKNGDGDSDPFTVLKALPKTDANLLATRTLLIPPSSDVLCGSALTIEAAADKSDVVFVGAITELGPAIYHQPNVPSHLDTYPALLKPFEFISARHPATQDINQTTDHNYSEQPAREGSSYIFFMIGRDAVKILPATDENLAKARGIASRVVAHGAEKKPPGYYNLGQIASDQKALVASRSALTKLPGSDQKAEEVIPKCNVVFEGQILTVGSIGMEVGGIPGFFGNKVKVLQVFRGSVDPMTTGVDYEVVDTSMELVPQVGDKCLFLAHRYTAAGGIDAGTIYYRVLKVLAATDDNITKAKQLAATLPASDE